MTSRTREAVPEWLVERLARGELPPEAAADVRRRLVADGTPDRLAELAASDRAILAAHPPAAVAAEVRRRVRAVDAHAARSTRARAWRFALPGAALAAAAAAVLLVAIRPDVRDGIAGGSTSNGEEINLRGLRPHLLAYRKTASGAARLEGTRRARAGDVLQLSYVSAGRRFGVILSVDARGIVTLHLPESPGPALALVPRGENFLPHAFALDDTPGFERFVFVTADVPFSTGLAEEALRAGGRPLPEGFLAAELVVEKESP